MGSKGRYENIKRGKRVDLTDGNFYQSGWEADFSRFLNLLQEYGAIDGWDYEPQEFSFQGLGYKRGPFIYKPDYAVRYSSKIPKQIKELLEGIFCEVHAGQVVYIEVKGQETGKDRNKWRRFRKHVGYPLEIVKKDKMYLIQELFKKHIPHWESHVRI